MTDYDTIDEQDCLTLILKPQQIILNYFKLEYNHFFFLRNMFFHNEIQVRHDLVSIYLDT